MNANENQRLDLHEAHTTAVRAASHASMAVGEDWNQIYWQTLLRQRYVLVSDPDAARAMLNLDSSTLVQQAPQPHTDGDVDFQWEGNQFILRINFSQLDAELVRSGLVWAPRIKHGLHRNCQRQPPAMRPLRLLHGRYTFSVADPTSPYITQSDWRNADAMMYRDFLAKYRGTEPDADRAYLMNTVLALSRALEGK